MKDELNTLADQIQRITDYDDLYGDSESMQRFFFRSYTNMIRFWHRVHKECSRSRPYPMLPVGFNGSALNN
jgi:hypothetical protein